ncbi:NADH-quinone oxidoreductase subunit NuoH [Campylobacter sp. CCUG 57310]|uniref:NADH-quinone oxidoreductase subunit NuoH n=1 Tax=Campylobacter sp. CCUG 57310 TaxID=2517362 RepID=UPI001562EFC7|nr:NADH-quinone oxidoreductase subunit NuoH [Campylobacter sp. CCUG 57310]QKF91891.1 NADH:quinone oxidoreductase I, membrane subunit H [Campylobacter sp. CCUG 57310]
MSGFYIVETIVKALIIITVFATLAGLGTYAERKVLAYMQRRVGPSMVGPAGILQLVADMIKLFTKEDIVPQFANKKVFLIAPLISAIGAFAALATVPFLPEFELFGYTVRPILADVGVGVLYVLGVSAVCVFSPLLAGLASHNKYALIAAARAGMQLVSFEVVTGLSLLSVIMMVGSLSLIDINNYQDAGLGGWLIFRQPLAFGLFLIAAFVETNRTPFCLTENETELVAGYGTEYSGMRWGMFFIGEYTNMITASFLVSLIFLGGFNPVWFVPGAIMIILKTAFIFFFFLWTRAAWPHVRADQLMGLCWKVLMPLAVANILITGLVLV